MKIISIAFFLLLGEMIYAQELSFSGMQNGTLNMQVEEYDIFELSLASMALDDLNSESTKLKEHGYNILRNFPQLKESVEGSRLGQLEKVKCQLKYIVTENGRLIIKLESNEANTMLEFGKNKRQDLAFYSEDDDEDFFIAIGYFDSDSPVGAIEHRSNGDVIIYTGNISCKGNVEVTYLLPNKEQEIKNIEVHKQLKQNLKPLFKPDEDGLLLLECE